MVVGHQHRYKNSRIVTVPSELTGDDDSSRISDEEELYPGVDLTWFLLEIESTELLEEVANQIKIPVELLDEGVDRIKIPGFSHDSNNEIRMKLGELDQISNVVNIGNKTRSGSDVREHDGTTVLNIPHRLTPDYSVTAGNDPLTIEQKKNMDTFRELPAEALISSKDDIVFVADQLLTGSSPQGKETIYLLFDWESLNSLSSEYYELAFADTRDGMYVTDAETSGDGMNDSYYDVMMRVLEYIY